MRMTNAMQISGCFSHVGMVSCADEVYPNNSKITENARFCEKRQKTAAPACVSEKYQGRPFLATGKCPHPFRTDG